MNFLKSRLTALSLSAATALLPTQALSKTDYTIDFNEIIEAADYQTGIATFSKNTAQNPENNQAKLALGALQFLNALQGLQQDLYRYGAGNTSPNRSLRAFLPIFRVPVAPNPTPEPVSYQKTREMLEGFVAQLKEANDTLTGISDQPVKLQVDLLKINLDADNSGTIEPYENLAEILSSLSRRSPFTLEDDTTTFPITFDLADAKWLQGYSNLLMSVGNFLLAFDYESTYDMTFHSVFGSDATTYGKQLQEKGKVGDPRDLGALATPITFLHSINWTVENPDRLKATRQNLLQVMQTNYETWELIQKETDNDHEWLPNPNQTSPFQTLPVTQQTIDSWLEAVKASEKVLNGEVLIPHMVFDGGINMKSFFETAESFDLVLFITGPNAVNYIEQGEVWDGDFMRTLSRPLSRNFGAFAVWFN
ncbi:hypothetical protein [Pseudovibrio brasiliensis]|uniref:Uncharacterized protein n=1 Tax=Pseudovibrio brasiliensis TaxID=1898042 RepID=A0ABX8AKQ1_9HYPH|nr:hypothetical protein [Pseudovibrio brasiliensis]QUS54475.1 hypothetical protein KGB56_13850 [Pseudovibrio brasiliensis]